LTTRKLPAILLPVAFLLVATEFVFRMRRLSKSKREPRSDAVSVA